MEHCPLTGKACNHKKDCHLTNIIDGKSTSMILCNKCAKPYFNDEEIVLSEDKPVKSIDPNNPSPAHMLKTMMEFLQFANKPAKPVKAVKTCPGCKSTIEDIAKNGKLGCMQCYQFFGTELTPILNKSIQKVTTPPVIAEKVEIQTPRQLPTTSAILYLENLQKSLDAAIKSENFEVAADLHSKIKKTQAHIKEREAIKAKQDQAVRDERFEDAQALKTILKEMDERFVSSLTPK